ncbi:MAG: hypothetical protein WA359_06380 [Acidimicrobiales bacterium]
MVATYDDASLVVNLLRWGTEMNMDEAYSTIFSRDFVADENALENPAVTKVLYFGETIGALVKHEVLNKDLMLDIFWADGIWPLVRASALKARAEANEPRLYENFEALVAQ